MSILSVHSVLDGSKKHNLSILGYSILETLIIVLIISIITTFAVTAWGQLMAKKRTRATVETLYDSLKIARSESLKRRAYIDISFRFYNGLLPSWCYGLSDSGNCDCRVANACTINGNEMVINDSETPSTMEVTNLTGIAGGKSLIFEGTRGTVVNSGAIQFTDTNFSAVININAMGFISICSNNIAGYPAC